MSRTIIIISIVGVRYFIPELIFSMIACKKAMPMPTDTSITIDKKRNLLWLYFKPAGIVTSTRLTVTDLSGYKKKDGFRFQCQVQLL